MEVDTQGDAFFVAFPAADLAATAARTALEALADGPVQVRMGMHTGAPTVTADGYVGVDVHGAARIAALARGGQVVVSSTTAALLEDETLLDLGAHRLKDFEGATRLYQLGDGAFPPFRTPKSVELPVPATLPGAESRSYSTPCCVERAKGGPVRRGAGRRCDREHRSFERGRALDLWAAVAIALGEDDGAQTVP